MLYDFHTHTLLSDGDLSPIELIRRAAVNGYGAIAIADHAGRGYLGRVIKEVTRDCALAKEYWGIQAIPGVELTHVPAKAIGEVAREAKEEGALIVVVHGETIVEPVEPGTNRAAAESPYVDILAHPGLVTIEEAKMAVANGIYLEISARKGHSLTNGRVATIANLTGARLLLNSDAHGPEDLLTAALANNVALGAALDENEVEEVLRTNPKSLLSKLGV